MVGEFNFKRWEVVVSVEIHPLDIEGYQSVPVEFACILGFKVKFIDEMLFS